MIKELIGLIGTLVGIVLSVIALTTKGNTEGTLVILFLLVSLIITFIVMLVRERKFLKKERYADAVSAISDVFQEMKKVAARMQTDNAPQVREQLEKVVGAIAKTFSLVTGKNCRACIKVLLSEKKHGGGTSFYVETLCRDKITPVEQKEQGTKHPLEQNTDFETIFKGEDSFFANNLPGIPPGYKNSSFNVYGDPATTREWKLPYKSTIVWPVRERKPAVAPGCEEEQNLMGYLCVDAKDTHVFSRRYDVDLGVAFAEALYGLLKDFLTKKSKVPSQKVMKGEK